MLLSRVLKHRFDCTELFGVDTSASLPSVETFVVVIPFLRTDRLLKSDDVLLFLF